MGYYLLEHPNPHGDHFYRTRRGGVLAIVVHVTASLEDLDAVDDHSAEATAAYCSSTDRAVSWHSGSDTDSIVELLPSSFTGWHVIGYNSRTYGHEISKLSPDWRGMPAVFVDRTLEVAGRYLGAKARELGVPIRHASKSELDAAIAHNGAPVGFVAHADLDPDRRRDPGYVARPPAGDTFPWERFLAFAGGVPIPPATPAPVPGGDRVTLAVSLPVLKAGSTGQHVEKLQALINVLEAGPFAPLTVDGNFGPATREAVLRWQRHFALGADGIVGAATWKTLIELPT